MEDFAELSLNAKGNKKTNNFGCKIPSFKIMTFSKYGTTCWPLYVFINKCYNSSAPEYLKMGTGRRPSGKHL